MKKLITASVLSLAALSAHAADPGLYVFGNTGYNFSKFNSDTRAAVIKDAKAAGAIWELGAGYRFNQYLATELSYANFGKSKAMLSANSQSSDSSLRSEAARIAVLGILPVTESFEVYGKVSLNRVQSTWKGLNQTEKRNETRAGVGLGAQYHLSKNLALRGEYEYITGKDLKKDGYTVAKNTGSNVLKAGVSFSF
ncbi:hypothetical protein VK98_06000 [Chromobacterium sp. LK11]|uniref:outer membrane beta-barrel protein n=1 Tax=Chromobacterium sp. LK11 TaxID=1628212 RepID=UPI0006535749|nr:porin [Chromobacterium sp. LK11]KMN83032.1 hypothetical protein VK98_06000 [Chromobacterium sp. LK11]